MPCPTCGHTMQKVASNLWWCPRCGSIQGDHEHATAPQLVDRCRKFAADDLLPLLLLAGAVGDLWQRVGIAESIGPYEVGGCAGCGAKFYTREAAHEHECPCDEETGVTR